MAIYNVRKVQAGLYGRLGCIHRSSEGYQIS